MTHMKLGSLLIAVLLTGGALGYWLANQNGSRSTATDTSTPKDAKGTVLYWHDPMVPGARFDKPGKSPFMDMQLVPVYADKASDAAVRVRPNVAQSLGIRLGKVERTELQPRLSAVGSVAFDEQLLQLVQARTEGYVTRLHVKSHLEHVKRGQPLADVLAPQWLSAQEEYLSLLDLQTTRGEAIRDAARQRLRVLGVPEETILAIEKTHKTRAVTTVTAPIDGVVTELATREGATFMPGAPLFRINGLGTVWVNAQIPESQVSIIPPGSHVIARAIAWPGLTANGRVATLLPDVDAETRTIRMRIVLDNPGHKLAPGMFVSLELTGNKGESQLVVPSEAVIATGERTAVIVAREGGGFDVIDVTTGSDVDGKTVILSGLTEGQPVVLSGQFLIDSEASLKSTAARLSTAADNPPLPAPMEPPP